MYPYDYECEVWETSYKVWGVANLVARFSVSILGEVSCRRGQYSRGSRSDSVSVRDTETSLLTIWIFKLTTSGAFEDLFMYILVSVDLSYYICMKL